jgi:hypothetical protein
MVSVRTRQYVALRVLMKGKPQKGVEIASFCRIKIRSQAHTHTRRGNVLHERMTGWAIHSRVVVSSSILTMISPTLLVIMENMQPLYHVFIRGTTEICFRVETLDLLDQQRTAIWCTVSVVEASMRHFTDTIETVSGIVRTYLDGKNPTWSGFLRSYTHNDSRSLMSLDLYLLRPHMHGHGAIGIDCHGFSLSRVSSC